MALILEDRVKVNTTTTGTGTVVLAATAPTGYQTFAVIGNNNTTYYTIAGQTTDEWEVGIGTYYLANSSLSRDTILSSSAANAAVTFTAGTKDVFVTYPSEQAVYEDATGNISSYRFLGGSINNMTIGATTANTGAFTNITATTINSTSTTLLATSSGNVGVGTTTVPQKLNVTAVNSTGFAGQRITNNNANIGIAGVEFSSDSTYAKAAIGLVRNSPNGVGVLSFYNATSTGAADWTTSDVKLTINQAGNLAVNTNTLFVDAGNNRVGIGTAAPANLLDVQAASNATITARIYNANTNSATQSALVLNAGGRSANFYVNYAGSYFFHQGSSLTASYTDYDTQQFRNNAGLPQLIVSSTASANNAIQVTGGAGVGPTISSTGTDTNIDIKLTPKGTGYANITSGGIKFPDATVQTTASLSAGNSSIIVNNVNITSNATIAAGQNGFSVGPVTQANGVSVTIASGQRWVVI